jgi:arsenate reductase
MTDTHVVLFLCVHNAGRSLAAKVLLDHYAEGRIRGLDPSKEFPKPLTDETAQLADVIVTMGCGDTCPVYPGTRHLDWELDDPAGKSVDEARPIVDEIDRRVRSLLAELVPTAEVL